jgi:hypothetical protein
LVAPSGWLSYYKIVETGPADYEPSYSGDCWPWHELGFVGISRGEDAECTITNTYVGEEEEEGEEGEEGGGQEEEPATGTLTLVKQLVDSDFHTLSANDFTLTVSDGEEVVASGVTGEATFTLPVGTYTIGEDARENYALIAVGQAEGDNCPFAEENVSQVVIAEDGVYTCTFLNAYTATTDFTLSVNVERGEDDLSDVDYVLEQNNLAVEPSGFLSGLARLLVNVAHAALSIPVTSGSATPVPYGSYTIMVYGLPSGYSYAFTSGDCDAAGIINVSSGSQGLSCTLTLTKTSGGGGGGGSSTPTSTLQIVTSVVNDDGGTLTPDQVLMTVTGNPASVFGGFASPGITLAFSPGAYAVTSPNVTGYTRSETSTCSGTTGNGQHVVCVVTYDDESTAPPAVPPTLPTPPTPPAPPTPPTPPTPPAPPAGQVLGATDENESAEDTADELPRTGMPVAGLILPLIAAAAVFRTRRD